MEINTLNENTFVDLFAGSDIPGNSLKFGMSDTNEVDLLAAQPDIKTDETKVEEQKPEEKLDEQGNPITNVDILTDAEPERKPGRPAKNEVKDLTTYFEDRLKSGKFVAIEEDSADGTKTQFIPRTAEEFDEVIDLQVNYKLEEATKKLQDNWYSSKSPAWQAVAKYAELTDDPTEILPFLQGVKSIDSVSQLDPKNATSAEYIIRTRLEQRGDSQDIIDEQIEALKTTDKLLTTAEKYKPLIVKEEQQNLSRMIQDRQEQEQAWHQLTYQIRESAIKAIEEPIFGKQKLKQEEKAIIYDMIGVPNEQTKGYKIYSAIDSLFETGNFDKLKKIALIIGKEDSFLNYISSTAADKTAENLQKKLRVADNKTSTSNDFNEEDIKAVQRTKYSSQPRFGR